MQFSLALALLIPVLVTACGGDAAPEDASPDSLPAGEPVNLRAIEYAPILEMDLARFEGLPTGLLYFDALVGDGAEAVSGRSVTVHYTGYHPTGAVFDSSVDREPFTTGIGLGQVIDGWDQGIPGMRVGGRRVLIVPPHLGYGAEGYPPVIPPNAVLVFRVELLTVGPAPVGP